jgi:hypothetical protein
MTQKSTMPWEASLKEKLGCKSLACQPGLFSSEWYVCKVHNLSMPKVKWKEQ